MEEILNWQKKKEKRNLNAYESQNDTVKLQQVNVT